MKNLNNKVKKIKIIIKRLADLYPNAKIHLKYNSAFELLISTILSAQCTDELVNKVMVPLYKEKYKTPKDILNDGIDNFKNNIKSINFYNNKSKSIFKLCEILEKKYNGNVPNSLEELTELPGIGRKSANVILGNYFGKKDAIIVDTHFKRVTSRLGLTENNDPEKIELELKELVPPSEQFDFSIRIGEHGRIICKAKSPKCNECNLNDICPSAYK